MVATLESHEARETRWRAYKEKRRRDREWLQPEPEPLTIQERAARIIAIEDDDPPGGASWEVCSEWLSRLRREVELLNHTLNCGAYDGMEDEGQLITVVYQYLARLIEYDEFEDQDWWSNVWVGTTALGMAMTHPAVIAFEPEDLKDAWETYWHPDHC